MLFLPLASGKFVGFGHCRVRVDSAQYLVEAKAVLHGQHIFRQQFSGMIANDGNAKYPVLAWRR